MKQYYVPALLGFALINGMFSPFLKLVAAPILILAPGFMISSGGLIFYLASLVLSTLTIMLAGIPAAIYEHMAGVEDTNQRSWMIWLTCTAILSLPGLVFGIGLIR